MSSTRTSPAVTKTKMCLPNEPIQPIAEVFGEKPKELLKAANLLGGTKLALGDAAFEIISLKGIPLTYILWGKEEFPASANILYDASARCYLPTEDLAVLGEVTTLRLIQASKAKIKYRISIDH